MATRCGARSGYLSVLLSVLLMVTTACGTAEDEAPGEAQTRSTSSAPTQRQLDCIEYAMRAFRQCRPENAYIVDGCAVRASTLGEAIEQLCGYQTLQIWLYADQNQPLTPYANISWGYHTARCFYDNVGQPFVVDPAFSAQPMHYDQWYQLCTASGGQGAACRVDRCEATPQGYTNTVNCRYQCYGQLTVEVQQTCAYYGEYYWYTCVDEALRTCEACDQRCTNQGVAASPGQSCQGAAQAAL